MMRSSISNYSVFVMSHPVRYYQCFKCACSPPGCIRMSFCYDMSCVFPLKWFCIFFVIFIDKAPSSTGTMITGVPKT